MTDLMPAAFFGHGSPMNAIEQNRFTQSWREFGVSIPRPRAVLVVSAHWYINGTALTAMKKPKTIHDFYGFPPELFAVDYPALGDPDLAGEIAEIAKPTWVGLDHDSWGIDHGTWSVLCHVFPDADIPVIQLSIDAGKPFEYHVQLGAKLAKLREMGVLIVGSGNVVHNLRALDFGKAEAGFDWAHRFGEATHELMMVAPADAASLASHADFKMSAPTPDHFIPLLYLAGLAGASEDSAQTLIDGYQLGSLSMISYSIGAPCPPENHETGISTFPDPHDVPPESTNM